MTRAADAMVLALADEITDGDLVGVGLGTPLALLASLLARATHAPDAHLFVGGVVDPQADLETLYAGPRAVAGRASGYISHMDTMALAERQVMTLQFLRPAQVDGSGALNTSRVHGRSGEVRLPGGLATADVPSLLPRIAVYHPAHGPRSLPARVDTQTAGGAASSTVRGVVRVVTDLAVLLMDAEGPVLASVHPGTDVDTVVAATGFPVQTPTAPPTTRAPSLVEREAIARLDPRGRRFAELRVSRPDRGTAR